MTDIDALRDRARESGLSLPALDYINALEAELRNVSEIGDGDVQRLAESYSENLRLEAELRQERERADEAFGAGLAQVAVRADRAEADLARAREVIEKAYHAAAFQTPAKVLEILATYDQKEKP